jgi:hypothetical protein
MKVYVGQFGENELAEGIHKIRIKAAKTETGLNYTKTEFVKRKGKIVGMKVWVCDVDEATFF